MNNSGGEFAQRHPKINVLLGVIMMIIIIIICLISIKYIGGLIRDICLLFVDYLSDFVSSTDQIIVVAMITGSVSIIGVVISSIVAKIVDYRFNVRKLLYDKREIPYEQFIDMIYTIMEDTKKDESERMTDEELVRKISEFSRGLTLWGSNRVVKKWIKYRKQCENISTDNLFLLEDIIFEIRRDVGQKRKLKKGEILAFFINNIDEEIKKIK